MGEGDLPTEQKPQKRNKHRGQRGGRNYCNGTTLTAQKYKAPTTNLEDYIYEAGAAKHAAQYTETPDKLCNYVQTNFKKGHDIASAMRQLTALVITLAAEPQETVRPDGTTVPVPKSVYHKWEKQYDKDLEREETYAENVKKAFALILEHCSPEMRAKLKGIGAWSTIDQTRMPFNC